MGKIIASYFDPISKKRVDVVMEKMGQVPPKSNVTPAATQRQATIESMQAGGKHNVFDSKGNPTEHPKAPATGPNFGRPNMTRYTGI